MPSVSYRSPFPGAHFRPRFATRTSECREAGRSRALFPTPAGTIPQDLEVSAPQDLNLAANYEGRSESPSS
jgi:hypothetical protein